MKIALSDATTALPRSAIVRARRCVTPTRLNSRSEKRRESRGKAMQREIQLALTERFFAHIDQQSTDQAEQVSYNSPEVYTGPDHFAQERAKLFRQLPLLSALSCQLATPGAFLTEDFAGVPVLLTRGQDGAAHAFMNVCRHRGSQLESADSGCGRQRFSCPYHAWSYNLEGKLIGVPDAESFGAIDRAQHHLVALPVIERHGMIWVSHTPGGAAIDLDTLLGVKLSAELGAYDLARWHHYETRRLEYPMNWKGVLDTFLEVYHFGKLHRQSIASIFFDNLSLFDPFGRHLRMSAARRSIESVRSNLSKDVDLLAHMAHVYLLFPNAVVVRQGEQVETWRVYPGATPDSSRMVVSMFIPQPATTDKARRHWDNNMDLLMKTVLDEDFPVGKTIQANFHTGAQAHVIYGRNEPAIAHFHRMLREGMGIDEPRPKLVVPAALPARVATAGVE